MIFKSTITTNRGDIAKYIKWMYFTYCTYNF